MLFGMYEEKPKSFYPRTETLEVVSVVSGGENGGHDIRCTDGFPSPKSGPPGTTDIKQPA